MKWGVDMGEKDLYKNQVQKIFENRIVCEWLSSKQVAIYFGISENALRIMVHRRQIPYSKLGRRLRFHFKDVQALITIGARK